LNWHVGGRSQEDLQALLKKLGHDRVRFYCTDEYAAYFAELPANKHVFGKDMTFQIEQNNARQRHWFARFHRRSQVVTRAKDMIDTTMKLFKHYICDGHIESIIPQIIQKITMFT